MFEDRRDAGRALATLVATLPGVHHAVALALPRGGVPVAYEVARACNMPLDVLVVRKLGAPGQHELAIGAVASGGIVALNSEFVEAFHLSSETLHAMIEREREEIAHREQLYRGGATALEIEGRTVILIDDGLATGATMRAAARAVRPRAMQVIIAVPVSAVSTLHELESEADRVLCLSTPEGFQAVGQFYRDFRPTSDEEVRALLGDSRARLQSSPAA
jgi:predicted phosphoribosyltransferase